MIGELTAHQPAKATLILVVCVFLLTACNSTIEVATEHDASRIQSGALHSIEPIGGYPKCGLRALIWWQGLSEKIPTENSVSRYRVHYGTQGADGKPSVASGAIAFP